MILFPESVSLFFRQKLKDDLSQKQNKKKKTKKKKKEIWNFSKMFWKDGLSKTIALKHLSCIIWKDDIFFTQKHIFFFGRIMKDDLSEKIHGNMIGFCIYV